MGTLLSAYQRWTPYILSLLRIVAGGMLLLHGSQKLLGFPPYPDITTVPLLSFIGFGGFLELVGGLLLVIGLGTRPTAFILSGEMAVAYFMMHAPRGLFPIAKGGNGGELAALYCFVFLYLSAAGAGPLSLDALFRRHRTEEKVEAGSSVAGG